MNIKDEIKKLEAQKGYITPIEVIEIINKLMEVVEMQQKALEQTKNIDQELPRPDRIFEAYQIADKVLEKSKQLLEGE